MMITHDLAKTYIKILALMILGSSMQACSPVAFDKEPEIVSTTPDKNGAEGQIDDPAGDPGNPNGGTPSDPGDPSGGTPGGGTPDGISIPKIKAISPLCQPKTKCLVEFKLSAASTTEVKFDWKTNDEIYKEQSPSPQYIYGQPNVHYLPTQGQVSFAPGETTKSIYVENINPFNTAIRIFVIVSECKFGANSVSCKDYFN